MKHKSRACLLSPVVSTERVFSAKECKEIIRFGEGLTLSEAEIERPGLAKRKGIVAPDYRQSSILFLPRNGDLRWLHDRIDSIVQSTNDKHWRFRLDGGENLQFTRYGRGQYYDWHMDIGQDSPSSFRKLSIIVQLSDATNYTGGELLFRFAKDDFIGPKERGTVVVFPSYILHKVARIRSGLRYSLVQWQSGSSPFK